MAGRGVGASGPIDAVLSGLGWSGGTSSSTYGTGVGESRSLRGGLFVEPLNPRIRDLKRSLVALSSIPPARRKRGSLHKPFVRVAAENAVAGSLLFVLRVTKSPLCIDRALRVAAPRNSPCRTI